MKDILNRMLNHEELSREEMKNILIGITQSEYPNEQITALLTALQMRGVTVDELLGFRDGILETGVPAILNADRYIDVVGTGGDRKNTFNISTTACFVIAGAGYKVAKHGNYAATSVSGASNVIQHHGIKFTDDLDRLNRSLDEAGIVYLHAQLFAKAMKFVGPIRKALQFPTIFNLLGPLVNPSQPKCQLLGVANLDQMRLYNNVYQRIGIDYGIVNSIDGYDENGNPERMVMSRLHRFSMQFLRTVRYQHRKTLCLPMQLSASKCWKKVRRTLRNASLLHVSLLTAAVLWLHSRNLPPSTHNVWIFCKTSSPINAWKWNSSSNNCLNRKSIVALKPSSISTCHPCSRLYSRQKAVS